MNPNSNHDSLRKAIARVIKHSININDYDEDNEQDFDALVEIITAETYIAGIADTILSGGSVNPQYREILYRKFIIDDKWQLNDGSNYSLSHIPEVLEYSINIEKLRIECNKVLNI